MRDRGTTHRSRRPRQGPGAVLAVLICLAAVSTDAAEPDSSRVYRLDTVVVTADRAAERLSSATAAVSSVSRRDLRRYPVEGISGSLLLSPGFVLLDRDGTGLDPTPVVRGFYGGGETEYVQLQVNGRPVNQVESGLIDWDLMAPGKVSAVEILRGSSSALYGDAALGGVVNVLTADDADEPLRARLERGSYGTTEGELAAHRRLPAADVSVFGNLKDADGFRSHSGREFWSAGGSALMAASRRGWLRASALLHGRSYDDPGPLSEAEEAASRTASSPFYRWDHAREWAHRVDLDGMRDWGGSRLSTSLGGEVRRLDRVRTLPLSPDFADTQERVLHASRLDASATLAMGNPRRARLLAGSDASVGSISNRYYAWMDGTGSQYADTSGLGRGAESAHGDARRASLGAFLQEELRPAPALLATLGLRADWIHDRFDPRSPSTGDGHIATHHALSPKAGLNLQYLDGERERGHVYVNASGCFKAPTLDQMYDQRPLPNPFPPYTPITISNPALEPQRGTSVEAGLYHEIASPSGNIGADLSLSVYQMRMRDELDFDLQQYRYVNVSRSRHRGVEAGLRLALPGTVHAFANATWQAATFANGANEGKYLKAIPREVFSAGAAVGGSTGPACALSVVSARRTFLDDENTSALADYTVTDAKVSWQRGKFTPELTIQNLFGRRYDSTGFMLADPSGGAVTYLYPAAGRSARLAFTVGL